MKKKKILIAGSNGYIGSHVAHELIKQGHDVSLCGRASTSVLDNGYYRRVDFLNKSEINGVIKNIDLIYFFVGRTGNSEDGFEHPEEFISGNEITLINLLNTIKHLENKPRIIFPSTRLIYRGGKAVGVTEESELFPKSIYAINKLACENILRLYSENYGVDYSIFRISLPYGTILPQKKMSYGVMSYLIAKGQNGEKLSIFGDGYQKGSFIHITDLVNLLILGGMSDLTINQTFNIGGPDNLSIGKVVKDIAEKYSVPFDYTEWPALLKKTDQGDLIINSQKLVNLLGYSFKQNFDKWLSQKKH